MLSKTLISAALAATTMANQFDQADESMSIRHARHKREEGYVPPLNWDRMEKQMEDLVEVMTEVNKNSNIAVPGGRSTNPSFNVLTYSMLAINGYGCWCYFEAENMYLGKGEPVDPIDQYCRYLIEGYACAHWDAQNEEDYECIPWEEDYNAGVSLGGFYSNSDPTELLVTACNNNNPGDNCKIRACIVEGFMIINIVDAFFNNIRVVEDHRHVNGFDASAQCKVKRWTTVPPTTTTTEKPHNGNPGPPRTTTTTLAPTTIAPKNLMSDDEECCGSYPIRAPFHPHNGLRGCCGNKSYDRMMMQCCEDYGIPEVKAVCAA